ncbi:putative transcription factor bZIP family [Rosa chinensis]|uniref:Putative transcription factor bZIP family n=1 Tax=Rosa chinensis TaxID=74649 RepID=A0A2P6RWM1_ROSCH|nr:uncharacterized protein LOC112188873 [Rosa chinensis]PRQ50821.1 putative transcription factor bZIP family [Rosa chinensis]
MSRSFDPVDPLLGCSLFPKAKFSSDPSKPYEFDHDLQAIDLYLKSTTASLSGLKDHAKNISSGSSAIPQSDMSQALKCLKVTVKVPKKKPCRGKPIEKMDDLALLDELINEGEDSLHINVDLDTGKVNLTEEEVLLEIPDEFVEAEEDLQPSEKKKRKHHHHRDSEVTYTGKNVVGADAKKPRVSHQMTPETSQSPGLLAPNVRVVPKKPIKQLFARYGVADEKFVRSMLADLKDIDLDLVRAKDNSPQENHRIARESVMRALYNVYAIDASEEGTQLKEEVSNLSEKVKYLHGEKGKLEKERDTLNQNIAALTLKVSELEEERKKIPALEGQVEGLRKELEPLRGFEEKANSWKAKAEYLEGQIDEECQQAVEEYKGSQELVNLLLAARSKCISEKYREWSASGWIDAEKMKREVAEMKRKRQEEQARKEAESKSGRSGSHTEAQE